MFPLVGSELFLKATAPALRIMSEHSKRVDRTQTEGRQTTTFEGTTATREYGAGYCTSRTTGGHGSSGPRSISGYRLDGERLVRLTYLDDAGLFNRKQEPFIIIGGVLINADKQLIAAEDHIESLVQKHIPEKDWDGFVFHAMELRHGGKYFKRDVWPLEKRMEILADLAAIPSKFGLPVSFGFQERKYMLHYPEHFTPEQRELTGHVDAFARFCESVEGLMREVFPNEITVLIFEDRDSIRKLVKTAHAMYRDPKGMAEINPGLLFFPFTKIRDTVHFATKSESRHLQIADMCTFVIKRHMMGDALIEPMYQALKPWMIVLPKGEREYEWRARDGEG